MSIFKSLKWFGSEEPAWFGDEYDGALIDLRSGRELGHYRNDGCGKWDLWVCVSYWQALRLLRRAPVGFVAFTAVPRCRLWMVRAKSRPDAMSGIEWAVGLIELDGG